MYSGRAQVSHQNTLGRILLPFLAALLALFAACGPAGDRGSDVVEGRLAVLPLTGPGGETDELAAAMEDAVVAAAANVTGAEVVPVGQGNDVAGTAASMLLRGRITRAGDDVEISMEIVDPTDETRKHTLPVERVPAAELSTAVDRIAARVAGALAQHLDPEATVPWLHTVATLESYRTGMHADSLFAQNRQAEALPFLYEAYALDTTRLTPLFGAAAVHRNAGRASVGDSLLSHIGDRDFLLTDMERYTLGWYGHNIEEALAAAKNAAALDPKGWTYGVGLRANQAGHFGEAVDWLSRRQQLADEGFYWARTWPAFRSQYMVALHATGDHATELAEAQLARADFADNPWWIWSEMRARAGLGQADIVLAQFDTTQTLLETNELAAYWEDLEDIAVELMVHGQAEAGQSLQEKVVEHYREIGNPYQLADALGFAGRPQEAFEVLGPVTADATTPDQVGWYGAAAAIIGNTGTAEEVLARLEAMPSAATGNNLRYQAAIHGALGNCDRAIELYRQATDAGFAYNQAWGGEWWHRDWETKPVRENCPAFQTLLDKG